MTSVDAGFHNVSRLASRTASPVSTDDAVLLPLRWSVGFPADGLRRHFRGRVMLANCGRLNGASPVERRALGHPSAALDVKPSRLSRVDRKASANLVAVSSHAAYRRDQVGGRHAGGHAAQLLYPRAPWHDRRVTVTLSRLLLRSAVT